MFVWGEGGVPLCVCMCRPAYPKILPSILQMACVHTFRFMGVFGGFFALFFCFLWMHHVPSINQNKKVSKDNFSIVHLVKTAYELAFSMIQTHYKINTL